MLKKCKLVGLLILKGCYVLCLVAQSCPTLCHPMDCSPPGSSAHGDSPGKNTGVGCHALLQGIFPTQGLNPSLPHCRQILYHLSHQGSARALECNLSLLQGIFLTQELNWGLLHCRQILYQLSYQGRAGKGHSVSNFHVQANDLGLVKNADFNSEKQQWGLSAAFLTVSSSGSQEAAPAYLGHKVVDDFRISFQPRYLWF